MFSSKPLKNYGNSLSGIFPLELSVFDRCTQNCNYCFSMLGKDAFRYRQQQMGKTRTIHKDDPTDSIIKKFLKALGGGYNPNSWLDYFIHNRYPVVFSNNIDPLTLQDKQFQSTLRLLKFFADVEYPVFFQTKMVYDDSPERNVLPYILENKNLAVYVSINTLNDEKAKITEKGATPPSERIEKMKYLADNGKYVIMAINPYIHGHSDSITSMVEKAHEVGCKGVYFDFIHFSDSQQSMLKVDGKHLIQYTMDSFYEKGEEGIDTVLNCIIELVAACRKYGLNYFYDPSLAPYINDNMLTTQAVDIYKNMLLTNLTPLSNYLVTAYNKYKKPIIIAREELMSFFDNIPYIDQEFSAYDLFGFYNKKVTESPSEFVAKLGSKVSIRNFYRYMWDESVDKQSWIFHLDGLVPVRWGDKLEIGEEGSVLYCYYPDLISHDVSLLTEPINVEGWGSNDFIRFSEIDLGYEY